MPALPRLLAAVALCLALACATAHGEVHDRRGAADDKALSLVEVEAKVSHPFLSTMTRAFSALSTMTETVTIGNELLSQVPGGSVIGGAINAFLTWLVPQGGTQLCVQAQPAPAPGPRPRRTPARRLTTWLMLPLLRAGHRRCCATSPPTRWRTSWRRC